MLYQEIIEFWFYHVKDTDLIDQQSAPYNHWFRSSETFDAQINEKYSKDLIRAQKGKFDSWTGEAKGTLGLIILFDQFTRHIYRNSPQMYQNDFQAQKICRIGIEEGQDLELQLIERVFFYMPLMHAENIELQKLSVSKFDDLFEESQAKYPQNADYYAYHLRYAKQFYDQIAQYGTFPHRHKINKT